eukprot:SAG22_NODE_299_length_12768_cov_11.369426_9_plen_58_part_00
MPASRAAADQLIAESLASVRGAPGETSASPRAPAAAAAGMGAAAELELLRPLSGVGP